MPPGKTRGRPQVSWRLTGDWREFRVSGFGEAAASRFGLPLNDPDPTVHRHLAARIYEPCLLLYARS